MNSCKYCGRLQYHPHKPECRMSSEPASIRRYGYTEEVQSAPASEEVQSAPATQVLPLTCCGGTRNRAGCEYHDPEASR